MTKLAMLIQEWPLSYCTGTAGIAWPAYGATSWRPQ
jgi:hypothetical protein